MYSAFDNPYISLYNIILPRPGKQPGFQGIKLRGNFYSYLQIGNQDSPEEKYIRYEEAGVLNLLKKETLMQINELRTFIGTAINNCISSPIAEEFVPKIKEIKRLYLINELSLKPKKDGTKYLDNCEVFLVKLAKVHKETYSLILQMKRRAAAIAAEKNPSPKKRKLESPVSTHQIKVKR